MRSNPFLYEVNSRLFLNHVSHKHGRDLSLMDIPEEEWKSMEEAGFDLIWFMGIWQRSPGAKHEAISNNELCKRYEEVLPGWGIDNIDGSPYAIYNYRLDDNISNNNDLKTLTSRLNNIGLKLLVDFVPNHYALDTPLLRSNPDFFLQASRDNILQHPDWFYCPDEGVYFAHGRDPYFPAWSDTVQLNYFSLKTRAHMINELINICEVSNGVRCDMAMLLLNQVFEQVWGWLLPNSIRPQVEFWAEAISTVKKIKPEFIFIAEAYWETGNTLLMLGFDYVYNKSLYDKLLFTSADEIRRFISTDSFPLQSSVNFIENHDEPPAIKVFGRDRSLSAAIVISTLPGLRMFHQGQLQGNSVHVPVQMVTAPYETIDHDVQQFYTKLLKICDSPVFHYGKWIHLVPFQACEGSDSFKNILTWSWLYENTMKIIAVNYSANRSQCRVKMPIIFEDGGPVTYNDELTCISYEASVDELNSDGLYIDLNSWQSNILNFSVY